MRAVPVLLGAVCAAVTTALAYALGAWIDHGTGVLSLVGTLLTASAIVIPIAGLMIAVSHTASRALEARLLLPQRYDERTRLRDIALWAKLIATSQSDEGDQAGLLFLFIYAVGVSGFAGLALSAFASLSALPIALGIAALIVFTRWRRSNLIGSPKTAPSGLSIVICAALFGCIAISLVDSQNPETYKTLFLAACGAFGLGFSSFLAPAASDASWSLSRATWTMADTPAQPDHPPNDLTADLSLQGVSTRYSNQDPFVFEHLDLTITSGSFIGLCGGSGSGKTTLCRLLLGLLDPSNGEIHFGKSSNPHSAPIQFPQGYLYGLVDSPPMPQMSIEQIISNYGSLSHNRILAAATATGFINDIATFPLGLRTNVGPGGAMLSTSQRQLLQLTAAVARRPEVLVLDNPISALPDEERARVLLKIKPFVTTLIVASNSYVALSTADQVLTLTGRTILPFGK